MLGFTLRLLGDQTKVKTKTLKSTNWSVTWYRTIRKHKTHSEVTVT